MSKPPLRDLSPAELADLHALGKVAIVDVREPDEFAALRIEGAHNAPLSTFDPRSLETPAGRSLVFQCGSGKRSAMAVERCRAAGLEADTHLGGGIAAWREAGLPTVSGAPDAARKAR